MFFRDHSIDIYVNAMVWVCVISRMYRRLVMPLAILSERWRQWSRYRGEAERRALW